jgi:hypothetical protein
MKFLAILAGSMMIAAASASAASLCNCCEDSTDASCSSVCATVKPVAGQCLATVDYSGTVEVGPGVNPLYGISLRDLEIGTPNAYEREMLRRLLEAGRRGAEKDRRQSMRDFARGKVSREDLDKLEKRYEDAIVNYFLGMRAYSESKTVK